MARMMNHMTKWNDVFLRIIKPWPYKGNSYLTFFRKKCLSDIVVKHIILSVLNFKCYSQYAVKSDFTEAVKHFVVWQVYIRPFTRYIFVSDALFWSLVSNLCHTFWHFKYQGSIIISNKTTGNTKDVFKTFKSYWVCCKVKDANVKVKFRAYYLIFGNTW